MNQSKTAGRDLESLGHFGDAFDKLKDRVGELFDRSVSAPSRTGTIAALNGFRGNLHRNITLFLGARTVGHPGWRGLPSTADSA